MKSYHIITIGCQMNKSDSERIAAYLDDLGYICAAARKDADLVILVTCGVRQAAEDRIYGLIPAIKQENPACRIVISGCLSNREDVMRRLEKVVDIWLPITELSDLSEKLGEEKKITSYKDYLGIRPKYESDFSAFVPIGNGCNNFCAYCVVPFARGREVYRDYEEIYAEVKTLVERGYKEIVLIAQNVNSYKFPISNFQFPNNFQISKELKTINFSILLTLINSIPGNFWIRFATSHPKDMSDELIEAILACEKVCRHVHLPAQAGDDEVLLSMNRHYSRKHYIELVGRIRKVLDNRRKTPGRDSLSVDFKGINLAVPLNQKDFWRPPVSISTDIIVGFPGESRKKFENTLALFEQVKFDMAFIAQYSPRPGTAAEKLADDVPPEEKKKREEELTAILRQTALENNKKYLKKTVLVLAESANKRGEIIGRTESDKVVTVILASGGLAAKNMIGKFLKVKISKVQDFGLSGEIA